MLLTLGVVGCSCPTSATVAECKYLLLLLNRYADVHNICNM